MNNEELIARIEKLEQWKAARERQQITLPLDTVSIDILNNYFMRLTGAYITVGGSAGKTFITYLGQQKDLGPFSPALFEVGNTNTYRYSVTDLAGDVCTVIGTVIIDGARCFVSTSDTAPAPLVVGDTYFLIRVSDTTFKFSTDGITPINITDVGTGNQFLTFF